MRRILEGFNSKSVDRHVRPFSGFLVERLLSEENTSVLSSFSFDELTKRPLTSLSGRSMLIGRIFSGGGGG